MARRAAIRSQEHLQGPSAGQVEVSNMLAALALLLLPGAVMLGWIEVDGMRTCMDCSWGTAFRVPD